jgi:hypothetical protein
MFWFTPVRSGLVRYSMTGRDAWRLWGLAGGGGQEPIPTSTIRPQIWPNSAYVDARRRVST